jgi:hypothetical protein
LMSTTTVGIGGLLLFLGESMTLTRIRIPPAYMPMTVCGRLGKGEV